MNPHVNKSFINRSCRDIQAHHHSQRSDGGRANLCRRVPDCRFVKVREEEDEEEEEKVRVFLQEKVAVDMLLKRGD